jgi:hypothetical protein
LRQALERQTAAEEEASDRARAAIELAGERDRLTQELNDAERALRETRQRLEAASRVVEAQDRARAEVERLHTVVEHWHAWAAQAPVADQAIDRRDGDPDEPSHQDAGSPGPAQRDPALGERGDYVLLIPSGNGYALAPRAGTPPSAGEVIDVRDAETQGISRFTVARVGRSPLPDGGICVYLLSN